MAAVAGHPRTPTPHHHTGAASKTIASVTERHMIRQPIVRGDDLELDLDDRSMRFAEYVLAIVAIVAAGILAFLR